jgi:hypothetical protein
LRDYGTAGVRCCVNFATKASRSARSDFLCLQVVLPATHNFLEILVDRSRYDWQVFTKTRRQTLASERAACPRRYTFSVATENHTSQTRPELVFPCHGERHAASCRSPVLACRGIEVSEQRAPYHSTNMCRTPILVCTRLRHVITLPRVYPSLRTAAFQTPPIYHDSQSFSRRTVAGPSVARRVLRSLGYVFSPISEELIHTPELTRNCTSGKSHQLWILLIALHDKMPCLTA